MYLPQFKITMNMDDTTYSEMVLRSIINSILNQYNKSYEYIQDITTAINEIFNNIRLHAYANVVEQNKRVVKATVKVEKMMLTVTIQDFGIGIENVKKAKQPLYTTNERLGGMGFTVLESFTDKCMITSTPGKGTTVKVIWMLNRN